MKVVYHCSAVRLVEAEQHLQPEIERVVQRWSPRPGQFEFDLEELGALDSPTLVVVEDNSVQTAYLHGYWRGGLRAVRNMFGLLHVSLEQLEQMTPQELSQLLIEERGLDPEALRIEGEGEEKTVVSPVVFRIVDTELEWEAEGREAEEWMWRFWR